MADLHDLAAPYALDADERATFEHHLETCATCRAEVSLLLESAGLMAAATTLTPPARLKKSVMVAVDKRIGSNVVALPWYRRHRVAGVAVAAAVLVIAGTVTVIQRDTGPSEDDVFGAPDRDTISLAADGLDARFTYSLGARLGVFQSATLPALSRDQVYQLWLIDDAGAAPAGLFTPADDGTSKALVESVRANLVLGLTVEPAGGSLVPTGSVLLTASIG